MDKNHSSLAATQNYWANSIFCMQFQIKKLNSKSEMVDPYWTWNFKPWFEELGKISLIVICTEWQYRHQRKIISSIKEDFCISLSAKQLKG